MMSTSEAESVLSTAKPRGCSLGYGGMTTYYDPHMDVSDAVCKERSEKEAKYAGVPKVVDEQSPTAHLDALVKDAEARKKAIMQSQSVISNEQLSIEANRKALEKLNKKIAVVLKVIADKYKC